ncbi:hypothetical protein AMS66_28980 [Paenibacillus xylanivorans]|uniref:Uncharacterized protein n=1 Tax=Paenibacillus xylanivorans TaxID=1705561 RepID=A0A0M9BJ79_9BACL|nr:hypothetical protein AMS66_28980 [Paenibacillus xylanivorans]
MRIKSEKLSKLFLLIYSVIMLLFYCCYVFLENYRLKQSQQWISKNNLREEDVNSISQIGTWTTIIETTFLILFVITIIFVVYRYQKTPIKHFIILNAGLFAGIALVSFVISLTTSMLVGNLIQPVIIPTILLAALFVYRLWKTRN